MEEIIDLLKRREQVLAGLVNELITELKELRKTIAIKTIEMKIKE